MSVNRKPAIVLAHGMVHPLGAAADVLWKRSYFKGVPEYLRSKGYRVLVPKVSNMGHVADRAMQLSERIKIWDERLPNERVVVVGHSMGGLDARWMISNLHGDELVESLVTVGTPHRGCCVADFVVDKVPLMAGATAQLHRLGMSLKALECLSRRYSAAFNDACPDSSDVKYLSISGKKLRPEECAPLLRATQKYVAKEEGPNDGMVSVESSIWGKHLGVIPLDHFEQIECPQVFDMLTSELFMDNNEQERRLEQQIQYEHRHQEMFEGQMETVMSN